MKAVKVTIDNNIDYLEEFVLKINFNVKTFRYFNNRPVSFILNHLATFLFIENDNAIAYGHLDKEEENVWLGICVLPEYTGKGYGKKMMTLLLEEAISLNLTQILLTVDRDNFNAIKLYEKMNFIKIEEYKNYLKYQYNF